uniref:Uncharacterized protein n=1 Tax=Magallana gigas TaxID=29159 RepID=A0A8W8LZ60_MAGGI
MADTEESMSTEEIAKVVSALKQLKMKPKADSAEDFLSWMSSAVQEKKIKEEVGLRPSLKDICGHLYDKCKSFDELRTSVRKLEIEHHPQTTEKKSATAKAAIVKDQSADRFDSIEAKINQLTTEVRSMKEKEYSYTPMPQPYRAPRQPYQRGRQERGYRGGYRQYPRFPQPQSTDVAKEPQSSRPVAIEDTTVEKSSLSSSEQIEDIISKIQLPDDIGEDEKQDCLNLLNSYRDIFSTGATDIDNSAFRNENSQVTPSLDDDDQSTTEEASAAGSGEDASHQDREPENQPEEIINDDEPEDDVNNDDDDENIIHDVDSTDDDINESDDSEDEMPSRENVDIPTPAPRRSTRQRKMPAWTKEISQCQFNLTTQSVYEPVPIEWA